MKKHRFRPYQQALLVTNRYAEEGIPKGVSVTILETLGDDAYTGAVTIDELLKYGASNKLIDGIDLGNPGSLQGDVDFTVYDSDLMPVERVDYES